MAENKVIERELGAATAYAYAVNHGYAGTEEEFAKEQANFATNAQKVAEDREAVEKIKTDTQGIKDAAVKDVGDAKNTALTSIGNTARERLTAIQTAGSTQVKAVQDAGALEVEDVKNAGKAERAALDEAAEAKTAEVEERIEAKGAAVLATIPEEYTETYHRALRNESRISRNEKRITNLEQGITPDPYYVDDTVAYSKDVPANALPFAEVGMVGGMTYRINVGTEEAPVYELRSAPVTEVESVGANLFGGGEFARVLTENGGVLDEAAGTVSLYPENAKDDIYFTGFKPNTQYTFIFHIVESKIDNLSVRIQYTDDSFEYFRPSVVGESVIVKTSNSSKSVKALVGAWQIVTKFKYDKCGIFEGVLTADDFKPYRESITLPIPEAVQALPGYGQGNPDNPDEYNAIFWDDNGKPGYSHKGDIIDGAWGTLDKEEITDISDLLTEGNYIPVEGGGTVTMLNEYAYAVPSEITYALKEAE